MERCATRGGAQRRVGPGGQVEQERSDVSRRGAQRFDRAGLGFGANARCGQVIGEEPGGLGEGPFGQPFQDSVAQLCVAGEFVGGCDIMREMYASGELQQLLKSKAV